MDRVDRCGREFVYDDDGSQRRWTDCSLPIGHAGEHRNEDSHRVLAGAPEGEPSTGDETSLHRKSSSDAGGRGLGPVGGTPEGSAGVGSPSGGVRAFRKKPVVVEAVQYRMIDAAQIAEGVTDSFHGFAPQEVTSEEGAVYRTGRLRVQTLESDPNHPHLAEPNDWIIWGVRGEPYPCKPDIFAATYEPADAPSTESETSQADASRPRGAPEGDALVLAAREADWQQVVLNGGPPCFHVEVEDDGHFCLRAARWHDDATHAFVSLDAILRATLGTHDSGRPTSESPADPERSA